MRKHPGSERGVSSRTMSVTDKEADTHAMTIASDNDHDGLTSQLAAARDRMLQGLDELKSIVNRRGTSLMQRKFAETQDLLAGLEERTRRNGLPDSYIRMQLNDARLDALTLLSGLKVAMLYEHQRLLAPSDKLRSEIEASIERFLGDEPAPFARDGLSLQEELAALQHDFERLGHSEKLILGHESSP
jgi:hypothetical protein